MKSRYFLVVVFWICIPLFVPCSDCAPRILFEDRLDGSGSSKWNVPPANYKTQPDAGTVYSFETIKSSTPSCGAWAGDEAWTNYRVEFEILCGEEGGGFFGLDFHVSNDGTQGCNFGFYLPKQDGEIAFEESGRWYDNASWKLYLYSPRSIPFVKKQWITLRLDVGKQVANLYANGEADPVYTMYDLPFERGGIRFWEYHVSVFLRNLRVTELAKAEVQPILEDRWRAALQGNVIREWEITPKYATGFGEDRIPQEILSPDITWRTVQGDRRGVVNLIAATPGDLRSGVLFARKILRSDKEEIRKCWFTYTDRATVWLNGEPIFSGAPRGFYDPGRSVEDGFGRLIPDQFEMDFPLKAGENLLLVRSEVTEPLWGWAFWMRLDR